MAENTVTLKRLPRDKWPRGTPGHLELFADTSGMIYTVDSNKERQQIITSGDSAHNAEMRDLLDVPAASVQAPYNAGATLNGSVTLNRANGEAQKGTVTGNITSFNAPSNGVEGAKLRLRLLASGADRTFTPHAAILLASDSSLTFPKTMTSAKTYTLLFEHNGTAWMLMAFIGGH